jgi:hypothetical protein
MTSIQSLKKKSQQSAGNSQLNPTNPHPQPLPEPLEKLQPLHSQNETISIGPL